MQVQYTCNTGMYINIHTVELLTFFGQIQEIRSSAGSKRTTAQTPHRTGYSFKNEDSDCSCNVQKEAELELRRSNGRLTGIYCIAGLVHAI